MGQEAHGAFVRRLRHQRTEHRAKALRLHVQGLAPVAGEAHHPMARPQGAAEVAIEELQQLFRLDRQIPRIAQPPQPLRQASAGRQPQPLLAGLIPEMGSHQVRHHHHHRQSAAAADGPGGLLPGVRLPRARPLPFRRRDRQRMEVVQRQRLVLRQPADHGLRAAGPREVAMVADANPPIEKGARPRPWGEARLHGVGVDDEIIGRALEKDAVAEEQRQPLQGVAPLPMAGNGGHGQVGSGREPRQERRQGRIGGEGRQAGHQTGIEAAPHHVQHQALQHGHHRLARQQRQVADQREENGEKDVEVFPQEAGAARGAGDAHAALHPEGLLRQHGPQLAQPVPLLRGRGFPLAGEPLLLGGRMVIGLDQPIVDARRAEQVGHEATAAMAHQMQPCAPRQAARQRQGVVDRTDGEGVLLEPEHPLPEGTRQQRPDPRGRAGQLPEAPLRAGARAVHEHQQSPLRVRAEGGVIGLEGGLRADRPPPPAVQARRRGEARFDHLEQHLRGHPGGADVDHLVDGLPQPLARQLAQLLLHFALHAVVAEGEAVEAAEQPGRRQTPLAPEGRGGLPELLAASQGARGGDGRSPILRELQHHHPLVGQPVQGRHAGGGLPGCGGEIKGVLHAHEVRREEIVRGRFRRGGGVGARPPDAAIGTGRGGQQGGRGRFGQGHPPQRTGGVLGGGGGRGGGRHAALLRRGWGRKGWTWRPSAGASAGSWWRAGSDGWRRASRGRWPRRGVF